jgi:hypothetical protein
MSERSLNECQTTDSRERHVSGKFTVGNSEAVASQTPAASIVGFTVTKVNAKTGRYKLQFYKTGKHLKSITASYIGPDDTDPAGTTGEAGVPLFRVNNIKVDGSILFQARQVSGASAALTSGVVVTIHAVFTDE